MRSVWQWLVPAACVMHGLGMVGGVYFVFTTKGWPLSVVPPSLGTPTKLLAAVLWIVSGIAYVVGAWGLLKDLAWWRQALWVAAPTTVAGVALWLDKGLPPGLYAGVAFSIGVVVALLAGW